MVGWQSFRTPFYYWAIPATPSGCGPKSHTGSMRARRRTSLSLQSLQDSKPRAVEATRRMQTFLKSDGGRGSSQRVQLLPLRPGTRPGGHAAAWAPGARYGWGHRYCYPGGATGDTIAKLGSLTTRGRAPPGRGSSESRSRKVERSFRLPDQWQSRAVAGRIQADSTGRTSDRLTCSLQGRVNFDPRYAV